jgi:hypothetical protein
MPPRKRGWRPGLRSESLLQPAERGWAARHHHELPARRGGRVAGAAIGRGAVRRDVAVTGAPSAAIVLAAGNLFNAI